MNPLFGLLIFGALSFAAPSEDPPWVRQARQLIGVGDIERAAAAKKLRHLESLNETLKEALSGPYKFYALDVISVLQRKEFVDDLLVSSLKDDNGAVYLALNTLISPENVAKIEKAYREKLSTAEGVAPPCTVIMLDTLGKMGSALSPKLLLHYLKNPSFEIRASALYHAGLILKSRDVPPYWEVLKVALRSSPYQMRLQAVALIKELSKKKQIDSAPFKVLCNTDKNDEVRDQCEKL